MELLALAFIGLILYLFVRYTVKVVSWISGRRYRAYRVLAQRYRGRYESRGMSDPPTVSFFYNGTTVRVGLAPPIPNQPPQPRTRVVLRFAKGLPFRFDLAPVSRPAPPQTPRGTRPVRTNDTDFDRYFYAHANDADMARDFLSLPCRHAIGHLTRLGPPGGMLISINPERMLVQVDRNLGVYPDALSAVVKEALVIHDALITGVTHKLAEGVEVFEAADDASEETGPPLCKVCGVLIEEGTRMRCKKCKAPHHIDCWEFIGACSIFGCNCKEGVVERV